MAEELAPHRQGGLRWPARLLASFLLGAIMPVGVLVDILVLSDGTEPRGICEIIDADGRWLAVPLGDGTICIPNWVQIGVYVGLPTWLFGMIIFFVWTLLHRRRISSQH